LIQDAKRVYDGQMSVSKGMDSGKSPSEIEKDQVAFAVNTTFRESFPTNRPPFSGKFIGYDSDDTKTRINSGVFQGAGFYQDVNGEDGSIIVARGGRLFQIYLTVPYPTARELTIQVPVAVQKEFALPLIGNTVTVYVVGITSLEENQLVFIDGGSFTITRLTADVVVGTEHLDAALLTYNGGAPGPTISAGTAITDGASQIIHWDTNPSTDRFAYFFQAEQFGILLQGKENPIIFDGAFARRSAGDSNNEIPPGYVGSYINGRIWISTPTRNAYLAGDLVGDRTSGTQSNSFVDSVLKFTGNTYLNEGGTFSTPSNSGPITGIIGSTQLDTSLGQGPVMIFTTNTVFTNQAPVDATVWKDLQYPIQTVAQVDYGAMSPRSIVNVNSDAWYRSIDGVRSFIVARRNFNGGWGNVPMSDEMFRVFSRDSEGLLEYGSAVNFDNRLLFTCQPESTEYGVVHKGLAVINFDEISGMFNKSNPCWEGIWTGLKVFQIIRGRVGGNERTFMIALGTAGELELWELEMDGISDSYMHEVDGNITVTHTPIQSTIETRSFNFGTPFEYKMLEFAEWFVDRLNGSVDFDVRFRPDQYPCWVAWVDRTECNTVNRCDEACGIPVNYKPGYRPFMRTSTAPESCLTGDRLSNRGYEFQLRMQWTGKCRIKQIRVHASRQLDDTVGEC